MAALNRVQLIGNIGSDPERRSMADGTSVANVSSLATTEVWKDRQTGERRERTEWHRVLFFAGLADVVGEHLKKGAQIYVEGKLRTRSWTRDGVARYTTEVIADDMQMLGRKPVADVPAPPQSGVPSFSDELSEEDIPF